MPSFMSQQEFDAGGPQSGGVAATGGGIGQLASVLAQGPRIRAQAGLLGAETAKTQAETTGLTADQAQKQDIIARQREIMTLASDPNTASNPAARQRLLALGSLDPIIAPHLQTMLSANMGLAALNGLLTARQRDAFSGATGVAAWSNTETGGQAGLANTLAAENIRQAGETSRNLTTQQHQDYRTPPTPTRPAGAGPATEPTLYPYGTNVTGQVPVPAAQQQGEGAPIVTRPANDPTAPATVSTTGAVTGGPPNTRVQVGPAEQQDLNTPIPVVIAGSPSGTKPFLITKREMQASPGKYTEITGPQQAAEAAPTTVLDASGQRRLMGTGEATATNAIPPADSPEAAWTGPYQRTLPDALAGKPFDLTPPAQPGQPPGPPAPSPQLDANGQPIPGSPLATVIGARPQPAASLTPVAAGAEEGRHMQVLLDEAAAKHFPPRADRWGGTAGNWDPEVRAEILRLTNQKMTSGPYRGRAEAAMEAAIQELQTKGDATGRTIEPDAPQGWAWGGGNLKGFQNRPGAATQTKSDTATATKTDTSTAAVSLKPDPKLHDYQGKTIGIGTDNQWYYVVDGKPTTPVKG